MIGEVCRALGVVDLPILSDLVHKACPILRYIDWWDPFAVAVLNLFQRDCEIFGCNGPAEAGRGVLGEGFEAEG